MAPRCTLVAFSIASLWLAAHAFPREASWRASVTLRGGESDEIEVTAELQELVDDVKLALSGEDVAAAEAEEEDSAPPAAAEAAGGDSAAAEESLEIQVEAEEEEADGPSALAEVVEEVEPAASEAVMATAEAASKAEEAVDEAMGEAVESVAETVHVELPFLKKFSVDVGALAQLKPGLASALLGGGQFAIGDMLSQKLVVGRRRMSFAQCVRLSAFGALLSPLLYRLVTSGFAGKTAVEIVKRIALDELVLVPLMLLFYFAYTGVTMGHSAQEVIEKVEVHLPQAVITSWILLPLAQVVDHHVKGDKQRLISTSVVMVSFAAYLSYIGAKAL